MEAVLVTSFLSEGCESISCASFCSEDVSQDGEINVSDILAILAAWGSCP